MAGIFRLLGKILPHRYPSHTLAFGVVLVGALFALWTLLSNHDSTIISLADRFTNGQGRGQDRDEYGGPGAQGRGEVNWQEVEYDHAYVSTAYLSVKDQAVVEVVGIQRLEMGPTLCLLWPPWTNDPLVVQVVSRIIPENHGMDYWVYIYSCPLNGTRPIAVSLVRHMTQSPPNWLPVRNSAIDDDDAVTGKKSPMVDFSASVAVLHSNYNDFRQLIETVEINRIFGVRKFVIYDYSSGRDVRRALAYYADIGVVDWIRWSLPVPESAIHYFGQLAAVNDCLLRMRHRTRFLLFCDLDEVVVPRKFGNWLDTVAALNTAAPTRRHRREVLPTAPKVSTGAYIIQNAFFPLDCEDSHQFRNVTLVRRLHLRTLLKTVRMSRLWPHGLRSKCLVQPELVTAAGIHYMWGFTGNARHQNVSGDVATLHHYRRYMDGCGDVWREDPFMFTRDTTMFRYRRQITKRVVSATAAIIGGCRRGYRPHVPKGGVT